MSSDAICFDRSRGSQRSLPLLLSIGFPISTGPVMPRSRPMIATMRPFSLQPQMLCGMRKRTGATFDLMRNPGAAGTAARIPLLLLHSWPAVGDRAEVSCLHLSATPHPLTTLVGRSAEKIAFQIAGVGSELRDVVRKFKQRHAQVRWLYVLPLPTICSSRSCRSSCRHVTRSSLKDEG